VATNNKYSLVEQVISQIARSFRQDDIMAVSATTMCALAGAILAQRLYAPGIVIHREALGRTAHLSNMKLPYEPSSAPQESIETYLDNERVWELVFGGRWNIFMQPIQIDKYGNTNLSLVGDKVKPKVVFVGSRGFPDNTVNCDRTYFVVTDHSMKVFVEKVDFISGLGHGKVRTVLGIKIGAPHLVFSNLGVFDFDEDTGHMRIKSINSGVGLGDIIKNTGFELIVPEDVAETPHPSEEELRLIRDEIDPLGVSRLDFAKGEVYTRIKEQIQKGQRQNSN